MLRAVAFLLSCALLGVGIFLYVKHHRPEALPQSCEGERIVAFGDSLVAGKGATTDGGFVTLLSQEASVPIANLGENGDTAAQAKARLASVTALSPDIVIVLVGGNDALRRVPLSQTEGDLDAILGTLQEQGATVILVGVLGGFPTDPYAPMFKRLAKAHDVPYVPNVLAGIIGHASLMSDEVHPNQAGYQKIADRLLPVLQEACGG